MAMMPPAQVLQQWQVHFVWVSCNSSVPLGGSLSDLCAILLCVRAWVSACVCSAAVCVLWLDANVSHSRRQSEHRKANAPKRPQKPDRQEEEKTLRNILIKIQCSPKNYPKLADTVPGTRPGRISCSPGLWARHIRAWS